MKFKEELNTIKKEVEAQNKKLRELTDDELAEVTGGNMGSESNFSIEGGTITANSSYGTAGNGGGNTGSASNITIEGGTITANGVNR